MPSFPLTPDEERRALEVIGVQTIEDLFSSIPPQVRERAKMDFGEANAGLSEHELRRYFDGIAKHNTQHTSHFLGGGVYDNIIPAIVNQLVLRGEFLTCYTPYQPEISQGTLQAIFEFQTMICRLTGMEVSNASLYDGASATAEAVMMAQRISGKPDAPILMAASTPPEYKTVVNTFLKCNSSPPIEVPWNKEGSLDEEKLKSLIAEHKPSALVVASPNYFGLIEPLDVIRKHLPADCLLIVTMADPSALSLFETPAALGADVVVGEAHQFGTPMLFGGPHVGFFATKKKFLRNLPGRLVGETVDDRGQRAYALTLATREQHIRREKATSNICTNQGLIALRTTIYLSFLGKQGLIQLGEMNYSLFDYLKESLASHGIPLKFKKGLHYREGVFEVPNLSVRFDKLTANGIVPGICLSQKYSGSQREEFENALLVCVHPGHTRAEIDALVEGLSHG